MNHVKKARLALTFDHGRNTSISMSERNTQQSHLTMGGTHPKTMLERHTQHSHLTMGGTHPKPMSERPCTYIWPCENTPHQNGSIVISYHVRTGRIKMALHLYLIMWEHIPQSHQSISTLTYDIVIFDLDMLWIFMEHRVLRQLHTILVVAIYTSSIHLEIKQVIQ